MTYVDMAAWPRRAIFEHFSRTAHPFYSVTFQLDVTPLVSWCKREQLSFYYALVGLCTRAINDTEAFRYDLQGGRVVLLPRRDPSFTDLKKDAEAFHIVTMPADDDLRTFCHEARERSQRQDYFLNTKAECSSLIYFSCLPWVELTGLTNEGELLPDDTVPRIAWGKYVPRDGRLMLGISMEVNHRFIDGVHIGRFAQQLETLMAELPD